MTTFIIPLLLGSYTITIKKTVIIVTYTDRAAGWKNMRKMRVRAGGSAVNYTATFKSIANPEGAEGLITFIRGNCSPSARHFYSVIRLCDYVITYGF